MFTTKDNGLDSLEVDQRYQFLTQARKMGIDISRRARKFDKKCGPALRKFEETCEELNTSDLVECDFSAAQMAYSNLIMALRAHIFTLYKTLTAVNDGGGSIPGMQAAKLHHDMFDKPIEGTEARIVNDIIYVKTMMLLPRRPSSIRDIAYDKFFAESLSRAIMFSDGYAALDITKFEKKHVHFYFAFAAETMHIIDTDNHDTKAAIDAVTCLLPGGDAATRCSISYASGISSDLPPGTYITISPGLTPYEDDANANLIWNC